ncbi:MAG: hypothetical protein LBP95_14520 [Deltaproteobacteria bacterium]|jgi:hypothetical protein|nr:hypothetical protein [Deltaproteobacteria bacterium]
MIKMSGDTILKYLTILGRELDLRGIQGEILIVGGAMMALVHNSLGSTKDINALYEPKSIIEVVASKIAADYDLHPDWLNNLFSEFSAASSTRHHFISVPGLEIHRVAQSYLLAMKLLAGRYEDDVEDMAFLFKKLDLETEEDVFEKLSPYSCELEFLDLSPQIIRNVLDHSHFLDTEDGGDTAEYDYWSRLERRLCQLKARKLELEKSRSEEEAILRKLQTQIGELENWPTLEDGTTLPNGVIVILQSIRDERRGKRDGLDRRIKELGDRIMARENLLKSENEKRWKARSGKQAGHEKRSQKTAVPGTAVPKSPHS